MGYVRPAQVAKGEGCGPRGVIEDAPRTLVALVHEPVQRGEVGHDARANLSFAQSGAGVMDRSPMSNRPNGLSSTTSAVPTSMGASAARTSWWVQPTPTTVMR